jgi:hypothetical protein
MSERRKWTEDDAQLLIRTLQTDEKRWSDYTSQERRYDNMSYALSHWMRVTARELFPGASYDELTDLLVLLRKVTRRRLGLET